jgi:DNA-3-methyladenine glycosylase
MQAGTVYVYLCYGVHWLLNVITGQVDDPQGVLIRACSDGANGPGKLTKALGINKDFNKLTIYDSNKIHIEDDNYKCKIAKDKRVGIGYASIKDQNRLWRFIDKSTLK